VIEKMIEIEKARAIGGESLILEMRINSCVSAADSKRLMELYLNFGREEVGQALTAVLENTSVQFDEEHCERWLLFVQCVWERSENGNNFGPVENEEFLDWLYAISQCVEMEQMKCSLFQLNRLKMWLDKHAEKCIENSDIFTKNDMNDVRKRVENSIEREERNALWSDRKPSEKKRSMAL
jgi:hypothetical protein